MFGKGEAHRFQVKWKGVFRDSVGHKPSTSEVACCTDKALENTSYYECAYLCPLCDVTKRFARKPLYPVLFKLKIERTLTEHDGDEFIIYNLFTCPKCHRFFASIREYNGQDLRDEQLLRTGQWIFPTLRDYALISEPYAYDEWKALVKQSEGLTNDPDTAPVIVAASDCPVTQKTAPVEAPSNDMASIIAQLIKTEYSDFGHVSISDAESTVRMLVHEVYGVYERQSSVYRYLTGEQPQRVGGYELNSRGEESSEVLEEEVPEVIQVTRNYLLLRATMENNTQEGLRAIERGANPNVACIYNGTRSFPIIEAALKGNATLVNALIEAGADVNIRKDNSEFALLDAACYEHLEAAEALLANGANPNAISRGLTPLTQAESVEMIQLLLRYGADPNIPDGDGDLPIVTRITNRDRRGTIALRDAGSDASHRNKSGKTADDFCQRYFRCKLEDL